MWCLNPLFRRKLRNFWDKQTNNTVSISVINQKLSYEIPKWPLVDLASLNSELKTARVELENVEKIIHLNPSLYGPIEISLRNKINSLMDQRRCFWAQRARRKKLTQSDANTKFLHALASAQRSVRKICLDFDQ